MAYVRTLKDDVDWFISANCLSRAQDDPNTYKNDRFSICVCQSPFWRDIWGWMKKDGTWIVKVYHPIHERALKVYHGITSIDQICEIVASWKPTPYEIKTYWDECDQEIDKATHQSYLDHMMNSWHDRWDELV